jgi:hypothetical protein
MDSQVLTAGAEEIDCTDLESWTSAIAYGAVDDIRSCFARHRADGPEILWSPPEDAMVPAQLRFLQRYWRERAASRPAPHMREIDAMDMKPALGFIVLLDVIEGGNDFRCRLFGSSVAAVSGFDMTGKRVSEHKASPYVVTFFLASYRAAYRRGEPLYTVHRPPVAVHTNAWHRLMLPLHDDEGRVGRFLSCNVPLRSTGETVSLRL